MSFEPFDWSVTARRSLASDIGKVVTKVSFLI